MKNILARGGIDFLAVLLGISSSLWIDSNRKEAEIAIERKEVYELINKEIDEIITYTNVRILMYDRQTSNINSLLDNWYSFNADSLENIAEFYGDIWITYGRSYNPDFTTYEALKGDGRINLLSMDIRKQLGKYYSSVENWKRIGQNENEWRNELVKYLAIEHPDVYANTSLVKTLEKTRDDKTVFTLFSQKSSLTIVRNNSVNSLREDLIEINNALKEKK